MQSYIVNGVRSFKGIQKIALYQPLTILDLVVYNNEKKDLQRISETYCKTPYQTIHTQIVKTSIAMFLCEFLSKNLKEESHPEPLFDFIETSLMKFDAQVENIENFHLSFLLKFGNYLGFATSSANELMAAIPEPLKSWSNFNLNIIDQLMNNNFFPNFQIKNIERKAVLDILITFYNIQLERNTDYKSIGVLNEVLK